VTGEVRLSGAVGATGSVVSLATTLDVSVHTLPFDIIVDLLTREKVESLAVAK